MPSLDTIDTTTPLIGLDIETDTTIDARRRSVSTSTDRSSGPSRTASIPPPEMATASTDD